MKKITALLLVCVLTAGLLTGCFEDAPVKPTDPKIPGTTTVSKVEYQPIDPADAVAHEDHTSVYEAIGDKITLDMVEEDAETGLAYVTWEGTKYELGMDFLSNAMVYHCGGSQEAFYGWWKLYIQRWNYLVPEVPLYTDQCFCLYNAKLQNFAVTPYWGPVDAIVAASIPETGENTVTLGSATGLTGAFRNASWGKDAPGSADLDIQKLTSGYALVQTDKEGAFVWNTYAVAETPASVKNGDGTLTYTVKLREDMVFSDGSPITAENYIAGILADSTPVGVAAGGTGKSGQALVGFDAFAAYAGDGEKVYFEGIKLLGAYSFCVTFPADDADNYYVMTNMDLSPAPLALYLGENEIVVDENGAAGLSDGFYAKAGEEATQEYAMAEVIQNNLKWDSALPYSGPYVVSGYDARSGRATLTRNPNYPGDTARGKASIETVSYIQTEAGLEEFARGKVDVLPGILGEETEAALALVAESPDKFAETHYDCAGYEKLGFRADFGPTSMVEVRQAIAYTINRPELARQITKGYGAVVHGPYNTGYAAYKAVEGELVLNRYDYSVESAVATLEAGGWIYNHLGQTYDPETDPVRYKKLNGYEKTLENLNFKSVDGKYATVKIDGEYYMPLAINWYGVIPDAATELLVTAWQQSADATVGIGMHITYTSCNLVSGVQGELMRDENAGYDGTPKLSAINFSVDFSSVVYDDSGAWSIQPDASSACFLRDAADYLENYQ